MSEEKSKAGRKTKFKEEYIQLAYNYALLGCTDSQLADFLSVHESTIHQWKIDYPLFSESLNKGKIVADASVAKSLYNRANGYSHPEVKVFNNQGELIETTVEKHYPPDPTSMIFWLKNRQPKLWRDKQEVEQSTTHSFENMSDENLNNKIAALAESIKNESE